MGIAQRAKAIRVPRSWLLQLKVLLAISIVAIVLVVGWFLLALFQPHQRYKPIGHAPDPSSDEFIHALATIADASIIPGNRMKVIPDGENFYEAELEAIRGAQSFVHLEAYIFEKGGIAERFRDALTERAKAGVQVRVVIDAVGALHTRKSFFKPLLDAGGRMEFYHPLNWYSWDRYNNRTHRELLVIDGTKAFIGGAGIADHWFKDEDGHKRWRDMMVIVEGPAVTHLESTFLENWVEASGELLIGANFTPKVPKAGETQAMVINSSAGAGKSTRARMLFQTLVAAARSTIYMQTPYFLPDDSFREELIRAVKRGVSVKIITAGKSDHVLTRSASRRLYGDLLENGVEIHEYQPAMNHVKATLIDGVWSVVGSTNADNRSFELNDEVNLAAFDGRMTTELTELFLNDLKHSKRMTYDEWKRRPLWERTTELFGRLIERQQ